MTASLYQSASCAGASSAVSSVGFIRSPLSEEVIEVLLAMHARQHAEDVCRNARRIELHEIACALPQVARAGQQVVHLVLRSRLYAERCEIELDPAGVRVVRIQVH